MELPAEMSTPSYFIYRELPLNGEPFDATAPVAFFPAKDSDELFDALRVKYPHVKSHSERMRDAVIEFLLQERQSEALSANTSPTMPSLYDSTATASPWQQSWPSVSSTTLSSPETMAMGTPSFEESPRFQYPQLARHTSTATASTASPSALENMTSVFSLSTNEQPKQRIRRKMTESEKVEYRKRRIAKACEKCSKRKRKCNHNKPDLEVATSDKTSHKVAKPRTATITTKTAKSQRAHEASASFESFDFQPLAFTPMEGFGDFTLMLDEPMPELTFDDYFDLEQQHLPASVQVAQPAAQWPWDDTQYWTPMHPTGFDDKGFDDSSSQMQVSRPSYNEAEHNDGFFNGNETPLSKTAQASVNVIPTNTRHALQNAMHPTAGRNMHQVPQEVPSQGTPGIPMLWEHLRTGQVEPTHTAHVHSPLAQGDSSPFGPGYAHGGTYSAQPSLSQAVSRLVHTARAIRAFTDILNRDVREIPMAKVAGLVGLASLKSRASIASSSAADDRASQQTSIRQQCLPDGRAENQSRKTVEGLLPLGQAEGLALQDNLQTGSNFQQKKDMILQCIGPDGNRIRSIASTASPSELAPASALVSAQSTHVSTGSCEGRPAAPSSISGGLTALAVQDTSLGTMRLHHSSHTASALTPVSRGEVSATSALSSQASLFDKDPTPQAWSAFDPKSGSDSTRPSTEMYRLKRRLPRALHSIVSKNRVEDGLADIHNEMSVAVHSVAVHDEGLNAHLLQPTGVNTASSSRANGSANFTIGKRAAIGAASETENPDTSRSAGTRPNLSAFASSLQQGRQTELEPKAVRHIFSESDTNRYRDHHGRTSVVVVPQHALSVQLAVLVAVLAFVSIVLHASSTVVDPTLLFMALLCPGAGIKGGHGSERLWRNWHRVGSRTRHSVSKTLAGIVECSEENSSWLAELPSRVVKLRSPAVASNCDGDEGAWTVGGR